MKNLVTLQSIYEQALELLIKYNPKALEELVTTHELDVEFRMKYRPINSRQSDVSIRYKHAKDFNALYMLANRQEPHSALDDFESQLKKHYGHGDTVLGMEEETPIKHTEDDLPY
jgi:hypothetical protein